MNNLKVMIQLCMVTMLVLKTTMAYADLRAQVLWIGNDFQEKQALNSVMMSELNGDEWGEPVVLYSSENPLTSPALGTDAKGNKLLIWTEQRKNKTILNSMRRRLGLDWNKPVVFTSKGQDNFSASIVFDFNDVGWVFWSSTRGDLSDIYIRRVNGVITSEAERVNAKNDVPDFLPVASINLDGNVQVQWNTYDFELSDYRLDSKIFLVETSKQFQVKSDELSLSDVPYPDFVPSNSRVLMHFPRNKIVQSRPL